MLLSTLCYARLQSALNRISCQIVCAIRKSSGEQSLGFPEAESGDLLKIDSVHDLA